MHQACIIKETEIFVKSTLQNAEGGHDWWHTHRVRNIALHIAKKEQADLFVVELAALLHDIADAKFNRGDEEAGPRKAREFLISLNIPEPDIVQIEDIIRNISFKSESNSPANRSVEFKVVQDADRLDAIGAIGIARTFNYGGFMNRPLYDPEIEPNPGMSKSEYKKSTAPTLNHFYEKLLLLKDLMNTETARKLAEHRHNFMKQYLDEFLKDWNFQNT